MFKGKKGFSLAETIIIFTIVGVIIALSLIVFRSIAELHSEVKNFDILEDISDEIISYVVQLESFPDALPNKHLDVNGEEVLYVLANDFAIIGESVCKYWSSGFTVMRGSDVYTNVAYALVSGAALEDVVVVDETLMLSKSHSVYVESIPDIKEYIGCYDSTLYGGSSGGLLIDSDGMDRAYYGQHYNFVPVASGGIGFFRIYGNYAWCLEVSDEDLYEVFDNERTNITIANDCFVDTNWDVTATPAVRGLINTGMKSELITLYAKDAVGNIADKDFVITVNSELEYASSEEELNLFSINYDTIDDYLLMGNVPHAISEEFGDIPSGLGGVGTTANMGIVFDLRDDEYINSTNVLGSSVGQFVKRRQRILSTCVWHKVPHTLKGNSFFFTAETDGANLSKNNYSGMTLVIASKKFIEANNYFCGDRGAALGAGSLKPGKLKGNFMAGSSIIFEFDTMPNPNMRDPRIVVPPIRGHHIAIMNDGVVRHNFTRKIAPKDDGYDIVNVGAVPNDRCKNLMDTDECFINADNILNLPKPEPGKSHIGFLNRSNRVRIEIETECDDICNECGQGGDYALAKMYIDKSMEDDMATPAEAYKIYGMDRNEKVITHRYTKEHGYVYISDWHPNKDSYHPHLGFRPTYLNPKPNAHKCFPLSADLDDVYVGFTFGGGRGALNADRHLKYSIIGFQDVRYQFRKNGTIPYAWDVEDPHAIK